MEEKDCSNNKIIFDNNENITRENENEQSKIFIPIFFFFFL